MIEPVAYKITDTDTKREFLRFTPSPFDEGTPLYTAEQLHPRVKMTKKQHDRLMWDKKDTDLSSCLGYFLEHDGINKFGLSSDNLMGFLTQEDIARAWLNPEETIEIVPDMKWFVRSKKCQNFFLIIADKFVTEPYGYLGRDELGDAQQFDTKEEAEKWVNPLTEAVQLPVEGE